jgi:hypothetical protein
MALINASADNAAVRILLPSHFSFTTTTTTHSAQKQQQQQKKKSVLDRLGGSGTLHIADQ